MADQLKTFFDEGLVRSLGRELAAAYPPFDEQAFVADCLDGLAELELIARGWHIAEAMYRYLPQPFARSAEVLKAVAEGQLERAAAGAAQPGKAMGPFRWLPHLQVVQKYGLDDFERSMELQYLLTRLFTAEAAIRPFLERYPEETYARLVEWASDPNVHVRRLVSEGTRPRLPWAARLRAYQADPGPVIALLELLKDDPERYVQRSVANNLNDIGKDHPDRLVEVCRAWLREPTPNRRWIVKHALRSLLKAGHGGALSLLGVGAKPEVAISGVRLVPEQVRIGGELRFSFELASTATGVQDLMVDFAVHYRKANGATKPKVFKLRRLSLVPNEQATLTGKVSFRNMTTRTHYPGGHRIEALVNGISFPLGEFWLAA